MTDQAKEQSSRPNKAIWLRPKAACEIGGFGMTTCYELINSGRLKSTKVRNMRLIYADSIEALGASDPE